MSSMSTMSTMSSVSAATEPAVKKQKLAPKKQVRMVHDVHMSDTYLKPQVKSSKCLLVPLAYAFDKKSPVLVQLSGGGKIPLSFGIDDTEVEGRRKVRVALQIEDQSDHDHLVRLRTELSNIVIQTWPSWYPDTSHPSAEVLQTLCNTFVSARKKKTNSEETWSGVSKACIEPDECLNGKCKIVDKESGVSVPFDMLPGMTWHKAILEFRHIYVQATKSYGVTRKLRYLSCSAAEDDGDIDPL